MIHQIIKEIRQKEIFLQIKHLCGMVQCQKKIIILVIVFISTQVLIAIKAFPRLIKQL